MSDERVDYVLPLRWADDDGLPELTAYLCWLSRRARVIVVDGSPPETFHQHAGAWRGLVEHVAPDPSRWRNGKVAGVHTGLRRASAERIVIADDDVRYDAQSLAAVTELLDRADLVGPQNVFRPLPWHAAWDTSRSLLNRAVAADYPGTFAVRRSTFKAMGGYDGDVLFENLELMRTVRAAGGRVLRAPDVYVTRRPPSLRRFTTQRVRQAYDDLAQPWRMAAFLAVLPVTARFVVRRRIGPVVSAAALVVGVAEIGRRRHGGTTQFPARTSWFAPLWVAERATCAWLALGQLALRGGVSYAGSRLRVAAHSTHVIRRRVRRSTVAFVPAGRAEAGGLVRPVAERLGRGTAAPTERDRRAAGIDRRPVGAGQPHRAPDDQRPIGVRRDDHDRVVDPGVVVGPALAHEARRARSGVGETRAGSA